MKTKTITKIVALCAICAAMAMSGCIENIESITQPDYPITVDITITTQVTGRETSTSHTLILQEDGSVISPMFGDMYSEAGTWTHEGKVNGAEKYVIHAASSYVHQQYLLLYPGGRATYTDYGRINTGEWSPQLYNSKQGWVTPPKTYTAAEIATGTFHGTWKRGR